MEELREELADLVERAKAVRNGFAGVKSASSLAAMDAAESLADLGQRFHNLQIKIKQAGRQEAQHDAEARRVDRQPKRNAAQLADAMCRRGAYRVTA